MNKTKVVIIGGGFGGMYTALHLSKLFKNNADITIINKSNYFIFTPLLHEVATGALTPHSVTVSLHEIFRGTKVVCVEDTVKVVDRLNKIVKTTSKVFNYDYLVISSGAETNYFSIPGAKENSLALKNIADAVSLRNHIISTFKSADDANNKELLTFAIVGAGATGVELAAELIEYLNHIFTSYYSNSNFSKEDLKVLLITNTPDVLSQFPVGMRVVALEELKRKKIEVVLNTTVSRVEPHIIYTSEGKVINANTIIWVAGVKPSLSEIVGVEIGLRGRMEVNEFLQSKTSSEIFGLGDAAGTYPMLAQIAAQQARTVAKNIYLSSTYKSNNNGGDIKSDIKLEVFDTKIKGLLISLGQWSAIGHFGSTTLRGPFMWWIWRTVYLFNFHPWRKRFEIAVEWTINIFYPREITHLK